MTIKFDPAKTLRKIAPAKKIERALSSGLSLKKTTLERTLDFDFLDADAVVKVALKAIKSYRKRVKEDPDQREEILDDPALLVQRVQNEVVFQIHDEIRDRYGGELAVWLPSSAEEPRPEHQLNYGKTYQIGVGIDGVEPGDEYGCQCGVEILVDDSSLKLE